MKHDKDLERLLRKMSTEKLVALHRVAKTRGRAFFKDPYAMMQLRKAVNRRKK